MDPLLRRGPESGEADGIFRVYAQISEACAHAGLESPDAEEIAQDIWEWLLRTDKVTLAQQVPWLGAVAQNFIRRFWRRSYRQRLREGTGLHSGSEPSSREPAQDLETKEILDRVSQALPDKERQLLTLIRSGHTIAEAARLLKIPRGSRAYYSGRLVACGRNEMQRRGWTIRSTSSRLSESLTTRVDEAIRGRKTVADWTLP